MKNTSWDKSGKWYNDLVGDKGHYYHQHVVLPGVLRLLNLQNTSTLVDIGCGQGILGKSIPVIARYTGIDTARNLIAFAQKQDRRPAHSYIVADCTKPLPIAQKFSYASAILSLQNMENQAACITNVGNVLEKQGTFVMVLNHPAFRIPRQSGWGVSENKLQYRYINRYMSPIKIPITMHPGVQHSSVTWSFHEPISFYATALSSAGFLITTIEEWVSDKESKGTAAKMENRGRAEIPLFLAIVAKKN